MWFKMHHFTEKYLSVLKEVMLKKPFIVLFYLYYLWIVEFFAATVVFSQKRKAVTTNFKILAITKSLNILVIVFYYFYFN